MQQASVLMNRSLIQSLVLMLLAFFNHNLTIFPPAPSIHPSALSRLPIQFHLSSRILSAAFYTT